MVEQGVRVAVVGAGGWGGNHVRAWSRLGHLRVVCDSDVARLDGARALAPDAQFDVSKSFDEVLGRDDIDAVVLATPAVTHAEMAVAALRAGKHVLVEKPLAVRLSDAEVVLAAAEESGRTLMVGHVLEYHPAVLKLRALVEEGALGRLRYIYSNRLNFGKVRTEENSLWSFAPHDLALCFRMVGSLPERVSCQGSSYLSAGVADVTLMAMVFPNGVQAHVFVSWLHPFKEQRFVVVGERQMAVFDDTAPWPEKLVLYPHEVNWRDGRVPEARKAEGTAVALGPAEPLLEECRAFALAVAGGGPVLTDGESALNVLRMLDAGERSMAAGGAPQSVVGGVGGGGGGGGAGSFFVHPSATVDEGVVIGAGTKVWHHAHVMAGARIGANVSLGQNVFVGHDVRIGDGVKVQNNVSVFEGVELEDDVFCGPSMVFTNVVNPRAAVERKDEFRATLVRRGATLGANCTVVCGVVVGQYALVGAGAVVTHDVPDYAIVVGVPGHQQGWACQCGVTLPPPEPAGPEAATTCPACGRAYALSAGRLTPRP
ncbi:MAG: UDP-2-acetamido-3-amino-2,3-dideoxy-glucuronate N-acetyltransferase [Acidimicrobiaceae bacterium]|nr:UDP-2-acetamido-3-amino-2,3-dideoxy-glucuronate N-acetyltransferase [Acidimicrobiaceae bacterium]